VSFGGAPWIDSLREYAFTLRLLGDTLPDDPGGEHTASAFDALMRYLAKYYYVKAATQDLPSDFFRFAAVVTDLLRSIEPRQRAAVFKLPPNDDSLSKRLRRLGLKRSLQDDTQWTCVRCSTQFTCTYPPTCPTCGRGWLFVRTGHNPRIILLGLRPANV
jgi:hypothetical protein